MSTVVALGHFCEVHGPRLVFYTIRNINEPQFVSQCPDLKFCSGCKAPLLEGYISTVQTVHSTPTQTPSAESPSDICGIDQLHPPGPSNNIIGARLSSATIGGGSHIYSNISASSSGQSFRTTGGSFGGPSSSVSIAAGNHTSAHSSSSRRRTSSNVVIDDGGGSRPSPATNTTTTNPNGATKYYCSHSNYDHSHLSHLHTCIARTLSCELSPSNSVAFTSSDIWVIGTAFSLKDSQARGFHRRYCLIFTFLPESSIPCIGHVTGALPEDTKAGGGKGAQGHRTIPNKSSNNSRARSHSSSRAAATARDHQLHPHHHPHDYYSDGDYKGGAGSNYYPSLVPYYEYITEEFYNVAKSLQSECEIVYFKEQSVSPQRAIRLSTLLDGTGGGGGGGSSATVPGASGRGGAGGGAKVFTRNHSSAAGARSLPLLTSNPHIFLDLHEKFAKILHHVDL